VPAVPAHPRQWLRTAVPAAGAADILNFSRMRLSLKVLELALAEQLEPLELAHLLAASAAQGSSSSKNILVIRPP